VVRAHGPLRGDALQRLAYGLASALAAVHAAGVVHRDLKPGNVMLVGDDPVVIDFGIAHAGDATRLTETGMFVGTPGYLAPEVIEGQPSGPAADIHSWGATVAFAATGRPPYGTGAFEAVFYRILHCGADLDGIQHGLASFVAAALARSAAQRPAAAWLADQVAQLDLTAQPLSGQATQVVPPGWPAPGATPATAAGTPGVPGSPQAVPPGWLVPGATPAAAPGTLAAPSGGSLAGPSGTAPLPLRPVRPGDGRPGGTPARGSAPGDVADLLPPVRYAAAKDAAAGQAGGAPAPAPPPRPRRHRLPALATLVIAAMLAVVAPVIGTVLVVLAVAVLRAGDRARSGLAARRAARGPRRADPLLVAVSTPWALARSLLVTVTVAPFALLISAGAALAAIIVARGSHLSLIFAYSAGLLTVLTCVGPASRGPRRQLNRAYNLIAPGRLRAATLTIVLGALAGALVSLAVLQAPLMWPVPDPGGWLAHLPGVHGLIHGTVSRLRHVGHGLARQVGLP
jgi:protein kinase-like protein